MMSGNNCRLFMMFGLIVGITAASGCMKSKPPGLKGLVPVTGKVLVQGQPAAGATVTLIPSQATGASEKTNLPSALVATVDATGKFEVMTLISAGTAKGAPPGTYAAAVSWTKPLNPNDRDSDLGPELLPAKYQDYQLSGLVADVKPGRNELAAWELEAKSKKK